MSQTPSGFIWYDLMTTDADAALAFYRRVIGWTAQPSGTPEMRYTMLGPAHDDMVAGLMPIPADAAARGVPPCWTGYIHTRDADATAVAAAAAGAAVVRQPTDIPGIGRFAVIKDPQGAHFNVFQPFVTRPDRATDPNAPGHIGWHELYAADWPRAFDFYAGLFGWTKDEAFDMGPMGTYQLFASGGAATGGMMNAPAGLPGGPGWLFYFLVDSAEAAAGRVTEAGGRVLHGPTQVPGGQWIVQCLDPQGAKFAVVSAPRDGRPQ